ARQALGQGRGHFRSPAACPGRPAGCLAGGLRFLGADRVRSGRRLAGMKVLLDTHVLVWAESLDDRLGDAARALLMDAATTLLVSPITSLELARLVSLSRLTLRYSLKDWLAQARQNLQLKDAP